MATPDIAPLIKAVRVNGVDTKVANVRYTEDAEGGILYLRVVSDTAEPDGPVELIDAEGYVLMACPDLTMAVAAGSEFSVGFGAASAPDTPPQQVATPPQSPAAARQTPAGAPAGSSDAVPGSGDKG